MLLLPVTPLKPSRLHKPTHGYGCPEDVETLGQLKGVTSFENLSAMDRKLKSNPFEPDGPSIQAAPRPKILAFPILCRTSIYCDCEWTPGIFTYQYFPRSPVSRTMQKKAKLNICSLNPKTHIFYKEACLHPPGPEVQTSPKSEGYTYPI